MIVIGKPLHDEDLVHYILVRLDEDYDSVVNSILAHPQAITVSELTSQMLAFESRVNLGSGSFGSSANFAMRGGRGGFNRGSSHGRGGEEASPQLQDMVAHKVVERTRLSDVGF
jgi:hypothetical protein